MSTLTLAEHQSDILASLRRLQGRGTVGDVVADSGLPGDDVRSGLKVLLESHQGHLAVSDSGELLYEFDEKLIVRGTEPVLARMKRAASDLFTKGFKATIVIVLVVYFFVFVALVIAALFANKNSDSRGGGILGGRRGGGHRHGGFGNFWLWYYIWTPRWRLGRPYYGRRWESTLAKEDRPPFYKKVFAFVFGPDKPNPTQGQLDRSTIRLIRARKGVITTAELVEHTALTFPEAEDEMGRLLGAYDGEAAVSPDGELVYAFPELMLSAHDTKAREPNPAWLRLEHKQELTGNTAGANAVVAGMNGFTLVAAATSPWFIFPRLGISLSDPAAIVGLVLIPVVFSVLFYGVPLLRMWGVTRENKRREKQNIRRVLLGLVYSRSLERDRDVGAAEAYEHVVSRLKSQVVKRADVEVAIQTLAAELDAEVAVDDAGDTRYRFPALRQQFKASETVRRKLQLENRTLGEIVFSTSDSATEAGERELALFDRQLTEGEADFNRYLPALDKIGFEDDYDLVAFDEELRQRGLTKA